MASFMVPRTIEFNDNLPREDSGKIFKQKLRARYWPEGRQIQAYSDPNRDVAGPLPPESFDHHLRVPVLRTTPGATPSPAETTVTRH